MAAIRSSYYSPPTLYVLRTHSQHKQKMPAKVSTVSPASEEGRDYGRLCVFCSRSCGVFSSIGTYEFIDIYIGLSV